MTDKQREFASYLEQEVKNHSIYVWGGQGETHPKITETWIRNRETSTDNANRAIAYWKKQVSAGYGNALKAFDCSGLAVYWLLLNELIKYDTTANGLKGLCKKIDKAELKAGDFVFRVSNNNAYHVGFVVDDNLNVIEAKGRDYGVVKKPMDYTYWNYYAQSEKIFGDAPVTPPAPPFAPTWNLSKLLKNKRPYMKGIDVQNAQQRLIKLGFSVGSCGADGIFGGATEKAVKEFQRSKKLVVDGIIGKRTCNALGGVWID